MPSLMRFLLPGDCAESTMPTTTMRAGVLLPSFSRAMSPSVEDHDRCTARCAQPVHHGDRLGCRTAVRLEPLRGDQKPAAIQRGMLDCRNDRAFDTRKKHGYMIRSALPTIIWR